MTFKRCNYPHEVCQRRATHKGMCQMHRKRWVKERGPDATPDAVVDLSTGTVPQPVTSTPFDSAFTWAQALEHFRKLKDKLKFEHVLSLASAAVDLGRPEYLLDLAAAAKVLHESLTRPSEPRTIEARRSR
jgi:hypothetical protein